MHDVDLRPLARSDFALLGRWLRTPHVHRWWHHETTPEALEEDFGPSLAGTDPAQLRVALAASRPFGFVQHYRFDDNPAYEAEVSTFLDVPHDAFSIDYFIGEPSMLRQGWGAAMIAAALAEIWRGEPNAEVIVPIADANIASRRLLERAGFRQAASGLLEPHNPIDGREHVIYRIGPKLQSGAAADAAARAKWPT
ncbi:MAG: acetyltransferase [Pseudomonadota bacterium]|nr:acetyltransferase [Pseudomonadota bacterium]